MKNIIYIISCIMLIGCNNDTITTSKKEINQDKLDYVKEIYLKCLEISECGECTEHYEQVKKAYNELNKILEKTV